MAGRDLEHDVGAADAIAPGEAREASAGRWQILVIRTAEAFHAVNNRCSHAAARLFPGPVRKGSVVCPRHGARFDLSDGRCVSAGYPPVRIFPLRIEGGRLLVRVPAAPPRIADLPIP